MSSLAVRLLKEFAQDTGLSSDAPPRRYLWTDAFAVCGFLALHRRTGEEEYLELALRLVDQVHHVLGRHRPDDRRRGWISGLDDRQGEAHPTAGGLRIGKPQPERAAGEQVHPQREWDRDGQYYHYLTRWMHALSSVWRTTGEPRYHRWAVELAGAAHKGFVRTDGDGPGPAMYWKMSIDLSRPLVPSMGQHDPLDGRITIEALRATAPREGGPRERLLREEASTLDELCRGRAWASADPLGAGGLLTDCLRLAQLRSADHALDPQLEAAVFRDALASLEAYARTNHPDQPAELRLAFREIGLSIGLHGVERIEARHPENLPGEGGREWLEAASRHAALAERIESFWSKPHNRSASTWNAHGDINAVMLAVSLEPEDYLQM